MTSIVQRLALIYIVEFSLVIIQWALINPASDLSSLPYFVTVLVLPFLAGYVVARDSRTRRLRYCAAAGVSVSLASIAAATLWLIFQSQPGEILLGIAGYVLSTIFIAVVPQSLVGLLGGWVGRKSYATSGI